MSFCGSKSLCRFGGLGGEKIMNATNTAKTRPTPKRINTKACLAMKSRTQVTIPNTTANAKSPPLTRKTNWGCFWIRMKKVAMARPSTKRGSILIPSPTAASAMIGPRLGEGSMANANEDDRRRKNENLDILGLI